MRLPKAAIVLLVLLTLAGGIYFAGRSGRDPQTYSNDFNVYYFAAREIIEGRDPYENSTGEWTPYLYPPLLAEAIIPLAFLPLPLAAYLWFLISAFSLFSATWMSVRLACSSDDESSVRNETISNLRYKNLLMAILSLAVLARFILDNFDMGQVNIVVMMLAVAHVYLHSKNKNLASSFALAVAVAIKLTPALLIFYSLARREWRFAAQSMAMIVLLTTLSFAPFGSLAPDAFSKFINRTIQNEQGFDLAYAGNQSLRGFLTRISDETSRQTSNQSARMPMDALALTLSFILLVLAIIAAAVARDNLAAAAPLFCCVVMLSPLAWKAHFVILLLPVVNLVKESRVGSRKSRVESRESRVKRNYLIGCIAVASFCVFNLTSPRIAGLSVAEWADSHSLVFAGAALIFFASTIIALSNRKRYISPTAGR